VFALVFALMGGYVAVVSVAAAQANGVGAVASGRPAATVSSPARGTSQPRQNQHSAKPAPRPASPDSRLAAALAPVVHRDGGQFAVAVFDENTGAQAAYHGGLRFHAASVENLDMLIGLLLQQQQAGMLPGSADADLAADMMKYSDNLAANGVWDAEGGRPGLAAANKTLGLRGTRLNAAGYWGLTSTTAADQLRLLEDLTLARSPLHAAARSYALRLMEGVVAGQRWGVSAAATSAPGVAIRNGWLPDPRSWVISSVGVVSHDGQRLLIAVLSAGNRTMAGGISLIRAAASVAATVIAQVKP
jgi:beta-lactamase class A